MDRMPAEEIVAYSQAHGFLAHKLYAIFTTPVAGLEAIRAASDEHLAHQVAIERDGILFGAGPLLTEDDRYCTGEGMIIVRARSLEEARLLADRDPMHVRGARSYTIRPWLLNEGSLDVQVHLSNGKARFR